MLKTSIISIGLSMLISSANAALVVTEVMQRGPYDPPTQVREHLKFFHLGANPEDAVARMKKEANGDKLTEFRLAAVPEREFIGKVLGGCVNPGWFARVKIQWDHDRSRWTGTTPHILEFISCGFKSRIAALSAVRDVAQSAVGYRLLSVRSEYDGGKSPEYANGSEFNRDRKPFACNVFAGPKPHLRYGYESDGKDNYVVSWTTDIAAITSCEEKSLKPEWNITARGFDAVFGTSPATQRDSANSSSSSSPRSPKASYPITGPSGSGALK